MMRSPQVPLQPSGRQKLALGTVWLALILVYILLIHKQDLGPVEGLRTLMSALSAHTFTPLLFIFVYALRPVLFFSAGLLSVVAGVLFGPVLGVAYTIIGSNLGAMLAYWIGRYFLEGTLLPVALEPYAVRMRRRSFVTVFLTRLFIPALRLGELRSWLAQGSLRPVHRSDGAGFAARHRRIHPFHRQPRHFAPLSE